MDARKRAKGFWIIERCPQDSILITPCAERSGAGGEKMTHPPRPLGRYLVSVLV